jgi:hypothetical protein
MVIINTFLMEGIQMNRILKNTSKIILLSLLVTVFGQSAKAMGVTHGDYYNVDHADNVYAPTTNLQLPLLPQRQKSRLEKFFDLTCWVGSTIKNTALYPLHKAQDTTQHLVKSLAHYGEAVAHLVGGLKEGILSSADLVKLVGYLYFIDMLFKFVIVPYFPISIIPPAFLDLLHQAGELLPPGTIFSTINKILRPVAQVNPMTQPLDDVLFGDLGVGVCLLK